jgi:hypothetical protein
MKTNKLLSVITYLMTEKINETPISSLYKDLDIFNIYSSGLCAMSLEDNLNSLFEKASDRYKRIEGIIKELSDKDIEIITELHYELYTDMFQKHVEDVDKRICNYIKIGEEDCLPNFFKDPYQKYSWHTGEDLVTLYFNKHGRQFSSLEEVLGFCNEEEIDTDTNLYDADSFCPSKYYILECLDEISLNGVNTYLARVREHKIESILS